MAQPKTYELNRLFAFCVTGILLGLLLLLTLHLGGRLPELPPFPARMAHTAQTASNTDLDPLFSLQTASNLVQDGELGNPFYTDYFVPQKTPPPAPPAPPTTRDVKLFFHGFYESANGKRLVYIKVDDVLKIFEVGEAVAGPYVLREVELDYVVLVNPENELAQLPFNKNTSIKVPIE